MDILDDINNIPEGFNISDTFDIKKINVAQIKEGDNLGFIYLDDNKKTVLKTGGETKLEPIIPYKKIQRWICYITGKSGCGKSRISYVLANQYNMINPNNKLYYYCATSMQDDENFSTLDFVEEIDVCKFYSMDMSPDDDKEIIKHFSNSLWIFDDLDMLPPDKKKICTRWQNKLVEVGRKYNISIIINSHIVLGGHNTKMLLNEVDLYFTFKGNIKNNGLLKKYYKYTDEELEDIKTTSWVCFNNRYDLIITPQSIKFKSPINIRKK